MSLERTLKLKGIENRYPIIAAGMGIGVSLEPLASEVGRNGGVGTISSVSLDQLTRKRLLKEGEKVEDVRPYRMDFIEATKREVEDTKKRGGVAAINIMCALPIYYEDSVAGAINGGIDIIVSGAGLPKCLPGLVKKYTGTNDHNINLVPIISSARALELICKIWDKQGYRPDAAILEGPKAGGHLGWNYKQITESKDFLGEYDLFKLLPGVLDIANKYKNDSGPIKIIPAGGIYTNEDIQKALYMGAAAVQMGTRFAATKESGFSNESKQVILDSKKDDIVIADKLWGSPCGYPFRYIKTSPLAKDRNPGKYFCICSTLLGAAGMDNYGKEGFPKGCPERYVLLDKKAICPAIKTASYKPLVTCGTEAYRVDEIKSVKSLMDELIGN